MTLEALFTVCNATVLGGWLLLFFEPWWPRAARLASAILIPVLFSCVYIGLMIAFWSDHEGGGFGSIEQVQELFDVPGLLLAGWIHYLTFDLFIGGWQTRDAKRRGIRHRYIIPCLSLTLLFGPVGLACYLMVRRTAGPSDSLVASG